MFPGAAAMTRVVPREGATIAGTFVPGGVSDVVQLILVHTHWIADCRRPNFHMCTPFPCGVPRPRGVHPGPLARRRRKHS